MARYAKAVALSPCSNKGAQEGRLFLFYFHFEFRAAVFVHLRKYDLEEAVLFARLGFIDYYLFGEKDRSC